jgi:ABC-type transporter Mla subunit MlaD
MWPRGLGRDRDRGAAEEPAWPDLVLDQLAALTRIQEELRTRLSRIEHTLADSPASGDQSGRTGLRPLVARLDHRLAALAAAATGDSPGSLATRLATLAPLPDAIATLATQTAEQGRQLDRHQGTLAGFTGALTALTTRLTALEARQQALTELLAAATATLQECRDQLVLLGPAQPEQPSGADALALLIHLLREPQTVPPLTRAHDLICFRPQAVTAWLTSQGLAQAAAARVRRVWRDARLVPAETTDNFNKRVRLPGGATSCPWGCPAGGPCYRWVGRLTTGARLPPTALPAGPGSGG